MGLIPFDKLARLKRIIKQNNGIIGTISKLWRTDTLKEGRLVGKDEWGNSYYENNYYMISRNRWVDFNPRFNWDYDASQVTATWFGWLHHKTDRLPCQDPAKHTLSCCCWAHCWLQPHRENMSGTDAAYYPYSTKVPHIKTWDGCTLCNRPRD
ncbi:putative NADH dehydrogenase [ubiquinone] 1 alpha subcomplex subunit 12 [Anticarsia gemmatalis]|uniref:putative NADH dehydrogenase [ubiquinone] 1 alpha subcomplex subunit 12 n=1 Tax=Anticarsia gemmatalis TaxID=129554 RepID=UPI003F7739BF